MRQIPATPKPCPVPSGPSRRTLLATAPAALIVATTAAVLQAPTIPHHPDGELLELFLSFVALEAENAATGTEPDGNVGRWDALWKGVMTSEATTPAGVLSKLCMPLVCDLRSDDTEMIRTVVANLVPMVELDLHPLARRVRNSAVALIEAGRA